MKAELAEVVSHRASAEIERAAPMNAGSPARLGVVTEDALAKHFTPELQNFSSGRDHCRRDHTAVALPAC